MSLRCQWAAGVRSIVNVATCGDARPLNFSPGRGDRLVSITEYPPITAVFGSKFVFRSNVFVLPPGIDICTFTLAFPAQTQVAYAGQRESSPTMTSFTPILPCIAAFC